ncbi:hypothetical protein [Nostoc sp.]|uniref:hypothetical protein n=1 Tax=Nostoc sp. TaxID=1180 RepID=UPI002FF67F55
MPNSNRDRIGTSGVDASSQDVDLTSYLNKLKQRVQQQWLPGMSQEIGLPIEAGESIFN